jgi:hypothetical protein
MQTIDSFLAEWAAAEWREHGGTAVVTIRQVVHGTYQGHPSLRPSAPPSP